MKKGRIFLHQLWVIIFGFCVSSAMAQKQDETGANPFRLGTQLKRLNSKELEDLIAQVSPLELLVAAMPNATLVSDAKERLKIMTEASIDFVKEVGFKRQYLVSLLMINQALEIVHGVLGADGKRLESPAVLKHVSDKILVNYFGDVLSHAIKIGKRYEKPRQNLEVLAYEEAAIASLNRAIQMFPVLSDAPEKNKFIEAHLRHWLYFVSETDMSITTAQAPNVLRGLRILEKSKSDVLAQDSLQLVESLVLFKDELNRYTESTFLLFLGLKDLIMIASTDPFFPRQLTAWALTDMKGPDGKDIRRRNPKEQRYETLLHGNAFEAYAKILNQVLQLSSWAPKSLLRLPEDFCYLGDMEITAGTQGISYSFGQERPSHRKAIDNRLKKVFVEAQNDVRWKAIHESLVESWVQFMGPQKQVPQSALSHAMFPTTKTTYSSIEAGHSIYSQLEKQYCQGK